jgi:antitoxin FitA
MGQILVRNVSDSALASLKTRARRKGTSLEQEVRTLIELAAELTPEEKVAAARQVQAMTKGPVRSLSLDEIREGLE